MKAKPEFSRLIAVEGIAPDKIRAETVEATAEECAALAKRFDLRGLSNLKANVTIRRVPGGTAVRVQGDFQADIVQACVVSLRDVHGQVQGAFDTYFTEGQATPDTEIEFSAEDDENAPEMTSNGMIDLGEVVAQYLCLDLDPYPRAPGVNLAAQMAESGLEVKNSPFQVLENLKKEKSE